MIYALLALLLALFGNVCAAPESTHDTSKVIIDHWLMAGPYEIRIPAFADTAHERRAALLGEATLDLNLVRPREGDEFAVYPGQYLKWTRQDSKFFRPKSAARYEAVFLASYILSSSTQNASFTLVEAAWTTNTVYLDGERVDEKVEHEGEGEILIFKRLLHRGKHLLIVKSVRAPIGDPWVVKATIRTAQPSVSDLISISTDPGRPPTNFSDITLFDNLSAPTLSPDGKWLAVVHSHRDRNLSKESWIEIYDPKTASLLRTLRPLKSPDNPFFFPQSDRLGFTASGDSGSTVWVMNLKSGDMTPAVKNIVGLQRHVCSPDGKFLYYSADAEKKINAGDPSLWTALEDRMSDWTNTRNLYVVSLSDGSTHEITATGNFAVDEFALSREGDKLLFTRRIPQVGRPYYSTEFWVYDIPSGKALLALAAPIPWERRPVSLTWLPGGEKAVYIAARHMVEPGDTTSPDLIECGLWLLDTRTGKTVNLSAKENFSAAEEEGRYGILWNESERDIWLQVRARGKVLLYRCDPLASIPKFTEISLGFPFIADFHLAANGLCAFIASDPAKPAVLCVSNSGKSSAKQITDPAKDILPSVELATFERWNFTDSLGYSIDGWLYYPPQFTAEKKWPLVVYYYGGTAPRDERYSFTYHWWAANGYVVYVLNPTGAMGYSEKFASLHANDWGTLATHDIIEGTRKLLAAKSFLDPQKMAAYGGSYGGFITQDLATKTDMFAALVSDAGISDIASYFGGGAWGFTYGDIALPESFPWNRPDIFAGKSPLYHADKIRTPLLLIHGLSDDNVPPVESAEMFTALKVLGRETAFARYPNEDHSIALKFSDYVDYRELMLAWFDKYLKSEPAAWEESMKKMGASK